MKLKHNLTREREWQGFDVVLSFEDETEVTEFVDACSKANTNFMSNIAVFVEEASESQEQQATLNI